MMIRTTLEKARAPQRIISSGERLNESRATPYDPDNTDLHKARYLLDFASVQLASGMPIAAVATLREALVFGCSACYIAINDKKEAPAKDDAWFLEKLRNLHFLNRTEFQLLRSFLDRSRHALDLSQVERVAEVISKVIDLTEDCGCPTPPEPTARPQVVAKRIPYCDLLRRMKSLLPISYEHLEAAGDLLWAPRMRDKQERYIRKADDKHDVAMVSADDEVALDGNIRDRAWALRRGEPMPELAFEQPSEEPRKP